MKKFVSFCLVLSLIVSSAWAVFSLTVLAGDESLVITASDIDSFLDAVYDVSDGGTVKIDGDIVVPASSSPFIIGNGWEKKSFTITGGSLNFSGLTSGDGERGFVLLDENVIFEDIKLIFDSERNDYLFASGYQLTIKESVVFEGAAVCLFGGAYLNGSYPNNKADKIDITILSGKYTTINGTSHVSGYAAPENVSIHVGGNATANTLLGNSCGCTVPGSISILVDGNASINEVRGSGNGGTVNGDVHVTLGGNANVKMTYGGGSSGTVKGNTYVVAKDNANSSCNASSHDMTYAIFGGGYGGTIEGSTNVLFTDNAKANYIWGGCRSNGSVLGGTNITMSGGQTMSMYGGGYGVAQSCDANVTLTGGTLEQVFGGCQSQAFTGDITIKLLGGTVTRRVFAGCYNEYKKVSTFKYDWASDYFAEGNITLIIDSAVSVDFSYDEGGWSALISNDHALSAHSRRQNVSSSEIATVVFTDSAAKSAYNGNLKTGSVSGGKATDHTHCYQYSINESVITQTCSEHGDHSATATVTAKGNIYTGNAINVDIAYSDNWEFEQYSVKYANNVNVGTATAILEIKDINTINYEYVIDKAEREAPSVTAQNESVSGKGDGKILGITTEMEYSKDGESYIPITSVDTAWEIGKYLVRYAETDNFFASESVNVEICVGRRLSVSFVADGEIIEVKYLDWDETLTDIPEAPEKDGFTVEWDRSDFTNIRSDVTVNAVYDIIPVITTEEETTVVEETTAIDETLENWETEEEEATSTEVIIENSEESSFEKEENDSEEESVTADESLGEETVFESTERSENSESETETASEINKESTSESEPDTSKTSGCQSSAGGFVILVVTASIPLFFKKKRHK